MKIRNINPMGEVDVPLLRRALGPDEVIEVTAEQASRLLPQSGNYAPADQEAQVILDELTVEGVPAVEESTEQTPPAASKRARAKKTADEAEEDAK